MIFYGSIDIALPESFVHTLLGRTTKSEHPLSCFWGANLSNVPQNMLVFLRAKQFLDPPKTRTSSTGRLQSVCRAEKDRLEFRTTAGLPPVSATEYVVDHSVESRRPGEATRRDEPTRGLPPPAGTGVLTREEAQGVWRSMFGPSGGVESHGLCPEDDE